MPAVSARYDKGTAGAPLEVAEHLERWSVQVDDLGSRLRIREHQALAVEIDLVPPQSQDFGDPATGEDQQPNRGDRGTGDGLRALGLPQRLPQPIHLRRAEV